MRMQAPTSLSGSAWAGGRQISFVAGLVRRETASFNLLRAFVVTPIDDGVAHCGK